MCKPINSTILLLFCLLSLGAFAQATDATSPVIIPFGGNAWSSNPNMISDQGVKNWKSKTDVINLYFKVQNTGKLNIAFRLRVPEGQSTIEISIGGGSVSIRPDNQDYKLIKSGSFRIQKPGYVHMQLKGIGKSGSVFADISDLVLSGEAVQKPPFYVKNNEDNYFYWGRRGPSVHLGYQIPEESKENIAWFYNEITVPKGNDIQGSYYMANGFSEGYFGIQVNSKTERRILFSVWSPFHTDDPKSIPDSMKIEMLKKGKNVKSGEFGNEGSGGQSYMIYNWEAGKTYRFLNSAKPDGQNNTVYTAYFFDPKQSKWLLIASFKRPKTNTHLKGIHSFLENFDPETGNQSRIANYSNQWICDTGGKWTEITSAKFTGDQTARKAFRKDYAGGISENNVFYLKNCGFFNETVALDQIFSRKGGGQKPVIDFDSLP